MDLLFNQENFRGAHLAIIDFLSPHGFPEVLKVPF
jgi:hypothetical protein